MKPSKLSADVLGIFSSMLCALHCTGFPAVVFLSSLNVQLIPGGHWIHYAFIGISLLAVIWSSKKANPRLRKLLWAFFIVFSLALLLHEIIPQAIYVSLSASIGLTLVHGINSWKMLLAKA